MARQRKRAETGMPPRAREYWRDVPGYDGEYQASTEGRVRHRTPAGGWEQVEINDNESGRRRYYSVWLKAPGGRWREHPVLRIVAMTWYPEKVRPGLDVVHRNGLHADNSAYNVAIMTRAERMRLQCSGHTRRAVLHVDARHGGRIIDIYPSLTAAAQAVGLSISGVWRHCAGMSRLRRDGTTFRWADMAGRRPRRGRT